MTVITMKTTMTTIPVTASHRDGNHSGHSHPAREKTGHEQASDEPVQPDEDDHEQDRVGLKEPDEISSGSMQNPHDVDATHRRKGGESFCFYKANVAETCDGEPVSTDHDDSR